MFSEQMIKTQIKQFEAASRLRKPTARRNFKQYLLGIFQDWEFNGMYIIIDFELRMRMLVFMRRKKYLLLTTN